MTNERSQRKLMQTSSTSDEGASAPRPTSAREEAREQPQGAGAPEARAEEPRWPVWAKRAAGTGEMCEAIAATLLLDKPLSSSQQAGDVPEAHPMLACAAMAVPWGSEEHPWRSPVGQSQGRGAAPGAAVPGPIAAVPWQRGRWRLLGFWLVRATVPGRRCRSSLHFNRAAAAPR